LGADENKRSGENSGEVIINMISVFIDESGTLPDIRDKFIVVCGVAVRQLKEAENIFSRILKSLRQRKVEIKEIKFYHAGQNTKRQFLSGIAAADFKIFAIIVDKKKRKIADNPENFALLLENLMSDIINWYKNESIFFVLDRHFHNKFDRTEFDSLTKKKIGEETEYKIKHVDSRQNFLVNIADMAAGAILWRYRGKDAQFYNLIKENIVMEKLINWPEIKKKSIKKIT
jgi:hypothetical protein